MTYAFTHMGNFLLFLFLGSGLFAGIMTKRLRFGPQGWNMGLQARIWASRLGFGSQAWDLRVGAEEEKEEKREKFPQCVKA